MTSIFLFLFYHFFEKAARVADANIVHQDNHKMFIQDRAGKFWRRAAVVSWMVPV
jgi:hypothetical protein